MPGPNGERLIAALRFKRKDAARLRQYADEIAGHPGMDPTIFYRAAESAELDGGAMVVHGMTIDDVQQLATDFSTAGFERPAVDDLSPKLFRP